MFEDKTYESIMEEMMEGFGADVRTDEGSLAFNACAKQAMLLEDFYADMSLLYDNLTPDTMDIDHLIEYANERGISYHYATKTNVKGEFEQKMELDEKLICGDYSYTILEKTGEYEYLLECDTEGTESNTNIGELEPADYIDNYQGGRITEVITPGTDDEDIEIFRDRIMKTFQSVAFGGNKAYYRAYINDVEGVAGCKPIRRSEKENVINIYVLAAGYKRPEEDFLKSLQEKIDPEEAHGEGEGIAPFCHNVLIVGTPEEKINISTTITFDDGYSKEKCETAIKDEIEEYLLFLRKNWENNDKKEIIVRKSQIEAKILTVPGVIDTQNTVINNGMENVHVDYTSIPILGEVIINV